MKKNKTGSKFQLKSGNTISPFQKPVKRTFNFMSNRTTTSIGNKKSKSPINMKTLDKKSTIFGQRRNLKSSFKKKDIKIVILTFSNV